MSYNDYIQPICLSEAVGSLEVDEYCVVTGWGTTGKKIQTSDLFKKSTLKGWDQPISNVLRQVRVPIWSNGACGEYLKNTFAGASQELIETQFCAGSPTGGIDACQV